MAIDEGSVGSRLRTLRCYAELTQCQVADAIGVRQGVVSNWERGEQSLPSQFVVPLAEFYHVPTEYLSDESACYVPPRLVVAERLQRRLRRPPDLPPYQSRGSLEQMLAIGAVAEHLYARVRQEQGREVAERVVERWPRDSAHELLLAFHLLAIGARLRRTSLAHIGCRLLVVDGPKTRLNALSAERDVLHIERGGTSLIFTPQVWTFIDKWNRCCRPDLLVLVANRQICWCNVELDGRHHDDQAAVDRERAEALKLARFGYPTSLARESDLGERIVSDLLAWGRDGR